MRQSRLFAAFCAFGTYASALPGNWQPWSGYPAQQAQALYFMTNDVSGNQVVSMSIGSDGSLSVGSSIATGGVGGNYVNGTTGAPHFPDALSSADAVVTAGNYVFVVNAGSNSVSMFAISPSSPTSLKMLGEAVSSMGDFPTTLAASAELGCVCVGNSGANSGISCSTFSDDGLAGFDTLRSMNVGEKVTPPTGPTPGFGDMMFSEDNTLLIAMVKGNGTEFTGYAATFPVSTSGTVGTTATMATPPDSEALFGFATIPGQPAVVFVSDAGFGALTLNVDNLNAQPIAVTNVTGQMASCWAQVSSDRGFITDAGVNRLVEANVETGAITAEYYPPTTFAGMTDFRISGNYLWALSASNGSYPSSIQTFDISGGPGSIKFTSAYQTGTGHNTQGMALW